jgi:hypothetical protein
MVALREPSGADELAIDGVDTSSAVALLERLLADSGVPATHLVASDRDALLAALHRRCWGDKIVTTLTCTACEQPFDLSFELSAVQRHLTSTTSPWRSDGTGRVVDEQGSSFKVPALADELAAAAFGPRGGITHLAAACGADAAFVETASAALEAAAPIVDLELAASCADCGHEQSAHFDLQSFVLQRVLNERDALLAEVHLLASTYGWSLQEILSLARSTRRHLASTIDNLSSRSAAHREARR